MTLACTICHRPSVLKLRLELPTGSAATYLVCEREECALIALDRLAENVLNAQAVLGGSNRIDVIDTTGDELHSRIALGPLNEENP